MCVGCDLEPSVQRQLFEDVVHVTLDSVRGNVKSARDFLIAEAFVNQTDDLPLTPGHPHRGHGLTSLDRLPGNLREQRSGKGGWQDGCALGHGADCTNKVVNRRILQDETCNACSHELDDVLLYWKKIHEDHRCTWRRLLDGFHDAQAGLIPESQIDQDDIRIGVSCVLGVKTAVRAGNDREVGALAKQRSHSLPQNGIVLDDQQSQFGHMPPHELDQENIRVGVLRLGRFCGTEVLKRDIGSCADLGENVGPSP